ncbi:MAG: helix-turn-helix domain-containing protein [Clostridia bacterium]
MLADTFHLSLPYLSKLFKETTGYNVLEYICLARLNYAKSLLRSTTYSIQYIAQEAGFNDSKRLVQLLKKYEGVTPSEFRKQ